jgi:MFS family permease
LFQGYAFLPIALAWGFGGTMGGWLYEMFGPNGSNNPSMIFLILFLLGVAATVLMYVYNFYIERSEKRIK